MSSSDQQGQNAVKPPSKKRDPYDPVGKRAAALDAALDLFSRKGFVSTSVQDIVDAAGMTKGAFYHHFQSKEDVLLEIREIIAGELFENAKNAVESEGSGLDSLCRYIISSVRSVVRHSSSVAIYFQELHSFSAEGLQRIRAHDRIHAQLIRSMISRAKDEGSIRPDVHTYVMAATIPIVINSVYKWYKKKDGISVDELSRMICTMVVDGVRA